MAKAAAFKQQEEEARRLRKESNAKKNRFYETSAERNTAWTASAKEKVKTQKLNRQKQVQQTKATVMSKTGKVWPKEAKVLDVSFEDFICLVTGIENEEHELFGDLTLVEASLNVDANWNILQIIIKRMVLKTKSHE